MSQPQEFNAIRENTAIEGLRLLLVRALYGKDDPTISWSQLIACAENLRGLRDAAARACCRQGICLSPASGPGASCPQGEDINDALAALNGGLA